MQTLDEGEYTPNTKKKLDLNLDKMVREFSLDSQENQICSKGSIHAFD